MTVNRHLAAAALAALLAAPALAQEVSFKDPIGDDNGPGKYTYPTDQVYKPGSFDLVGFTVKVRGDKADFAVTVNSELEDPWRMGVGFAVQMVFIHVKNDQGGFTDGLPGTNVAFAPDSAWNKVVILSPQPASRVKSEVSIKAGKMKGAVVVPGRTLGSGRTITGTVDLKELGGKGDPATWGFQVLMQSNEGFPDKTDLLTRKVNEYEGQHRFGGGTDTDCDPHVMDLLAGDGKGDPSEVKAQHDMLAYECNADGTAKKRATLVMVHMKK